MSDPVTPSRNTTFQCPDNTYANIAFNDDIENLIYENAPNSSTSKIKVDFCVNLSAVYSEPSDFNASETNRSTALYSEPYSSSVLKNLASPSSDIYATVN